MYVYSIFVRFHQIWLYVYCLIFDRTDLLELFQNVIRVRFLIYGANSASSANNFTKQKTIISYLLKIIHRHIVRESRFKVKVKTKSKDHFTANPNLLRS